MPGATGQYFSKVKPGDRYGRFSVVERAGRVKGHAMWLLECDCGTRVISQFKRGKSCGCLQREVMAEVGKQRRLAFGQSGLNGLYGRYVSKAVKRGLLFTLSKDEFLALTQQPCRYCGSPPSARTETKTHYGFYMYNGVDRVDNRLGYVPGNVVPCCKHCNVAKACRSIEEFLDWAKRVVETTEAPVK